MKSLFSIIVIVVPSLLFGYLGKPTEMGLAVVAGGIAAAFLNIDKIARFKGAGFEAEMKEAVKQAYATIDHLKELSTPLFISTISTITRAGRWGGMDFDQKHSLVQELENVATSLDLKDVKINSAVQEFYRYHTWDQYSWFVAEVAKQEQEIGNKLHALKDYSRTNYPSKKEILDLLGELNLNSKAAEHLEDYLYYLDHQIPRRKHTEL